MYFRTRLVLLSLLLSFVGLDAYGNYVGDAVLEVLRDRHGENEQKAWFSSSADFSDNWLLADPIYDYLNKDELPKDLDCDPKSADCDPIFKRNLCSEDTDCEDQGVSCSPLQASISPNQPEAIKMCQALGDKLVDRFYDIMASTDQHLDFTGLTLPDGRFYDSFVNALAMLSVKEQPPTVRLLYGGKTAVLPNFAASSETVLNKLLEDVNSRGGDGSRLPINLAWLSTSRLSWNHSKIIISDRNRMINGGHNMWDGDYLGTNPVFDISLELTGPAAQETQLFVDELWSNTRKYGYSEIAGGAINPPYLESFYEGEAKVIGVGRLGAFGDDPADDAITAMIVSAKKSIFMSQQDLFTNMSWKVQPSWAAEELISAAISGVKVNIIGSNKTLLPTYGMVSAQETFNRMRTIAKRRLVGRGRKAKRAAMKRFCENFTITPFRFNEEIKTWTDGGPIGNHSKLIVIDEKAFYVGSQNFYPANLQEHGIIVADETMTNELMNIYWHPLWEVAKKSEISCR